MSQNQAPPAKLTTVARFPTNYFLENLAVRSDNSVLVTAMNTKELWYVPPQTGDVEVTAIRIHTFEQPVTGIVEVDEDVFLTLSGNLYTTHESFAHRLDLTDWQPGSPVEPKLLCQFPKQGHHLARAGRARRGATAGALDGASGSRIKHGASVIYTRCKRCESRCSF